MGMDIIARGLVSRALRTTPRQAVALAIVGQSNERGNVLAADQTAYPQAFRSLRNPSEQVPIGPSVTINGGWWHHVYDALWDWGYDVHMVNAAIGSASFLLHFPGYLQGWTPNNRYASKRASQGAGDRGDFGDLILVGGKVFNCAAGGMTRFGVNSGPERTVGGVSGAYLDTMAGLNTGALSGASDPGFAGVAIGGTINDNGLTWKRLDESFYSGTLGGVLSDDYAALNGRGFDPLGLLQRTYEELQRARGVSRRIVYIANGQTDLGIGSVTYGKALEAIARFFLKRGIEVMIGLTTYAPGTALGTTGNYNNLSTGVTNAIAALQAAYPGKVHAGANLYQLMGSTGPMGGANFTGTIAGNVLTVTAVSAGGSGLATGQQVARADGTVIGTIASPGTGSGGTGTYNLTGGVDTASQAMRSFGAFLQPLDGVHINGRGAVGPPAGGVEPAGKHVADALKALLARRPVY